MGAFVGIAEVDLDLVEASLDNSGQEEAWNYHEEVEDPLDNLALVGSPEVASAFDVDFFQFLPLKEHEAQQVERELEERKLEQGLH